jgi:hypothetical protein
VSILTRYGFVEAPAGTNPGAQHDGFFGLQSAPVSGPLTATLDGSEFVSGLGFIGNMTMVSASNANVSIQFRHGDLLPIQNVYLHTLANGGGDAHAMPAEQGTWVVDGDIGILTLNRTGPLLPLNMPTGTYSISIVVSDGTRYVTNLIVT